VYRVRAPQITGMASHRRRIPSGTAMTVALPSPTPMDWATRLPLGFLSYVSQNERSSSVQQA
jgi:hypothetical protein